MFLTLKEKLSANNPTCQIIMYEKYMTESSKRKFVTFRFPDNSFQEKYRLHWLRSWLSSALGDTKVIHSKTLNLQRVYQAEKYCKRQKKRWEYFVIVNEMPYVIGAH